MIYVSPAEPKLLHSLGRTHSKPEKKGVDFLFPAHSLWVGIQRKVFPNDLLSSLSDGRIHSQLAQMSSSNLAFKVLILEGRGNWTGQSLTSSLYHYHASFTRKQLTGILLDLAFVWDVIPFYSDSIYQTADLIAYLYDWFRSDTHNSLNRIPKPNPWKIEHPKHNQFLQGFPGIGSKMAGSILSHFGRFPLSWDYTADELQKIPGIGKKRAQGMVEFLEGGLR